MPNPLDNVTLSGTAYAATATIQDVFGGKDGTNGGGTFDISGGSVYYSLQYPPVGGNPSGYGTAEWTQESLLRPYSGIIPAGALGIKFRNADSAVPATVNAYIAPPNQPILQLNSANSITTTTTMAIVNGSVSAAGAVTDGSGFTVNKTGTGVYVITFTTSFAGVPTVVLAIEGNTGFALVAAGTRTVNGLTVNTFNSANPPVANDRAFELVAVVQ